MPILDRVREAFSQQFGGTARLVVRAPGRVNLIGEHTDYNDGFVLPMAVDRAVWIALRPRADRLVLARSLDMPYQAEFSLDALERGGPGWHEYVKGMAWALQEAGHLLCGWEGVLAGDVPVGAGLSSSAALEMAVARAFCAVSGVAWAPREMALLGQRAESRWVGVNCGVMDQMISATGRAGHALLIDCRTLETEPVPLPRGTSVLVLDTSTRRGLVGSAYNERRAQCDAAARALGGAALRDISLERLDGRGTALLDEVSRRRARHVITENARTLEAADAMRHDDAARLGRLLVASHESLRDDFEVSSPELNALVACALCEPGCYGARMTGAGFGGCAVALVDLPAAQSISSGAAACFHDTTGLNPSVYVCQATDGAGLVEIPLD